ncbi:MAG: hypothetical protein Q4B96_01295 [Bacillota bacterium]|nr:hypothetical protein [Bacillota bacterium]
MINELYNLSKALDSNGVVVEEWHRKYKTLPKVTAKSPCIRIWLDDSGLVCGMESLSPEHASRLRKYGDNQSSFPAFNISPLYRVTAPDVIAELEKISSGKSRPDADKILSWCTNDNWIKGVPRQVRRSMNDCSSELAELYRLDSQTNVIAILAGLCKKAGDGFRASLQECAFDKLRKQEDIPMVLSLLFHTGSEFKKHSNDTGSKISVILDVHNWAPYGYPVASEYTTAQLNALLLAGNSTSNEAAETKQEDAFGTPFINPDEPMPSVKLAGFEATLRSMFEGQPCQYRYKQINDGSYPIAAENRSSIKKALEWIAQPSNRQITWVKLDKNEIAFIYPSKIPDVPPKFASLFGREQSADSRQSELRFESIAKDFVKSFQGIPPDQKPDIMQIFVIRKIDKARSQVIFTHNTIPEQMMTAADRWSAGCSNLPPHDLGEPDTPFPLDVPDILNAVWKQDGERADGKTPVKRMKYYQGIELLLDALPPAVLRSYLHIAAENVAGLLKYFGSLLHGKKKPDGKSADKKLDGKKAAAARSLCVLGLLLYKCDERKEIYMEELAFLLGQWLHVSDKLHTLYCIVKREGDVPPQLAGSALLVSAGEMPYQALAQLHSRMSPFISWAKQYRHLNKKKSKEADRLLKQFEMLADKITPQMDRSVRFSDFEKAELYIGYMASLPQNEKTMKTGENTIQEVPENE